MTLMEKIEAKAKKLDRMLPEPVKAEKLIPFVIPWPEDDGGDIVIMATPEHHAEMAAMLDKIYGDQQFPVERKEQ